MLYKTNPQYYAVMQGHLGYAGITIKDDYARRRTWIAIHPRLRHGEFGPLVLAEPKDPTDPWGEMVPIAFKTQEAALEAARVRTTPGERYSAHKRVS